ncbi:hypothetical protein NQ317_011438 [Molorchus minor]|uniref:Uncharacterized protein n=1 Tax=Molorchus minor TaxID=1323400 RepID=A0ABQ9IYL1_9CUCU|nr:hypothetical protein NQ317_011438 [Molorchus minor]
MFLQDKIRLLQDDLEIERELRSRGKEFRIKLNLKIEQNSIDRSYPNYLMIQQHVKSVDRNQYRW